MNRFKMISVSFCLVLALVALPVLLKADPGNKETIITFGSTVEIPGLVLTQGTYVFKVMDNSAHRDIVQIFNEQKDHIYATLLGVSSYRAVPPDKTDITFWERAEQSPQALKAWFYPGDIYGVEFVYPKVQAQRIAMQNSGRVLAIASDTPLTVAGLKKASIVAVVGKKDLKPVKQSHTTPIAASQPKEELEAFNAKTPAR